MSTVYYTEIWPKRRLWEKKVEIKGESVVETSWKCIENWDVVDNNPRLSTKNGEREIVSYVIDKALLKIGRSCFEKVTEQLNTYYNYQTADCYENPECLKRILNDFYGRSYQVIIDTIYAELWDYATNQDIVKFMRRLSSWRCRHT